MQSEAAWRLLADASIDPLAQQVSVPEVLFVLPDEMNENLAHRNGSAPSEFAEVIDAPDEDFGMGDFVPPRRPRFHDLHRIGGHSKRLVLALCIAVRTWS